VIKGMRVEFTASRGLAKKSKTYLPKIPHVYRLDSQDARSNPWLVSRAFDILFVCGLAPWLIGIGCFFITGAGGAYPPTKYPQQLLTFFFVASSLIIGESHQFTSIIRYYSSFRKRAKAYTMERIPFWIMYALALEFLALVLYHPAQDFLRWTFPVFTVLLQFAVILFPAVLMQHICAQAVAVGVSYCRIAGYNFSQAEKRSFTAVTWLLIATGACSIAVPFTFDADNIIGISTNSIQLATIVGPIASGASFTALICAAHVIFRGFKRREWPPLGAALLWVNLVLLILLSVPLPGMAYVWLFVPLFFHATQHWALAWSTRKREARTSLGSSLKRTDLAREFCKLVVPVVTLTLIVLFLPLLLSRTSHLSPISDLFPGETLPVFLSMFVFYMHYFADRVVWRPKT
jgi:hypothetical protein